MPTVDASVGTTTANSYVTVAQADSYFDGAYGRLAWANASLDDKGALLITASRFLDQMIVWSGRKVSLEQSMEWPRYDTPLGNYPGVLGAIPSKIKYATYELAYYMLENGASLSFSDQSIDKVKVGTISVDFSDTSVDAGLPTYIEAMLQGLGSPILYGTKAARSIDLVRA